MNANIDYKKGGEMSLLVTLIDNNKSFDYVLPKKWLENT